MGLKCFTMTVCLFACLHTQAQSGGNSADSCETLTQLLDAGSGGFVKIMGELISQNNVETTYGANKALPGATKTIIKKSHGLRYETVLYEGESREEMRHTYGSYRRMLESCLPQKGYEITKSKSSNPKVEQYQDIHCSIPTKENKDLITKDDIRGSGASVQLWAGYSEPDNKYSIGIMIY